ncbi:hypothetical protein DEO72_LG1g2820 [Vigna unguiculata]|uniref:Uncharacterized protein n=1 Tax=Vigna unguiculata TaxID=3917 RepID=A0A4D6KXC3_VIGUN|nr:hypothetical protein DEO72_LG1g2820 [Vigna unguiculata]
MIQTQGEIQLIQPVKKIKNIPGWERKFAMRKEDAEAGMKEEGALTRRRSYISKYRCGARATTTQTNERTQWR